MKNAVVRVATAILVAASLTGCAGSSDKATCESYLKIFEKYLTATMDGSPSAEMNFANGLKNLAGQSSGEISDALRADAMSVPDGYKTAAICKGILDSSN